MLIESHFHARTAALSSRWKDWATSPANTSYNTSHEAEHRAVRYWAGLLNITPLQKHHVSNQVAALAFPGPVSRGSMGASHTFAAKTILPKCLL